jgi:hypothetical protein
MPLPFAVATFCVTAAVCHERKRKSISSDQFVTRSGCAQLIQNEPQSFTVGEIDMSSFIKSSIGAIPSVKRVSVKSDHDRVQVDVAVDQFEWETLAPIYEKELDLSAIFIGQSIEFRVIDESPDTGQAATA